MASIRVCWIFIIILIGIQCIMVINEPPKINLYNQKNNMFQGDIANVPRYPKKTRNGIIFRKWPNAQIPYVSLVAANRQSLIQLAINRIQSSTCVRFVPRTNQENYVSIRTTNDGCYSSVGMEGGVQEISLQDSEAGTCMTLNTVVHELLHSVGLYHEQSRADRDNYITVQYSNMAQEDKPQFDIVTLSDSSYYDTKYDFLSVMHYDQYAFSNNGKPTIQVKQNIPQADYYQRIIGHVHEASATDFLKVNRMYNCKTVQPAQCVDTAHPSICSTYAKFCNDANIFPVCRKTCNRCT